MKKLLLLFGFLCLGMVSVNAQGWQQPEHVLSGYVKDTSGNPVSGVCVKFWSLPKDDFSRDELLVTYTNDDGYYSEVYEPEWYQELSSLGVNTMCSIVTCEKSGYVTQEEDLLFDFSSIFTGPISQDFTLEKEGTNQGLRKIRGVVKNYDGETCSGVKVSAILSHWFNRGDAPSAVTNKNGEYVINVPEDYEGGIVYAMKTEHEYVDLDGYNDVEGGFLEIATPLDNNVFNISLEGQGFYQEAAVYEVIVIDAKTKEPIANANLTLTRFDFGSSENGVPDPSYTQEFVTDNQGFYYTTESGWPRNYLMSIKCEADGYEGKLLTVEETIKKSIAGYQVNYFIFELEKEAQSCIVSGVVKDACTDKPVANAYIEIWGTTENIVSEDGSMISGSFIIKDTYTDENGYYSTEVGYFNNYEIYCIAKGYIIDDSNFEFDENGVVKNFWLKKEGACSDDAGLVDGINAVDADGKALKHYSVSGVEIVPTAKGLHIVNGKKVLVK